MISVVIPLYNKELSIRSTIQSVLDQTFQDYEVIVVNDGSTDNSLQIVQTLYDPRVKLISKSNGGVSSARNVGIKNAIYPYIAFLDADDIWEPTYLEEQWKMIQDFPDAGMWGTSWGTQIGNTRFLRTTKIEAGFRGYITDYFKRHLFLYYTCVTVINKDIFNKIDMFDERISCGEDLDLWYRIILNFPVAYYEKTLVYYRQDSENRITLSKKDITKHFVYYIDKFDSYRKVDFFFKKYYEHEVLGHLFNQFYIHDRKNPEIHALLSKIDFSIQPFSYKFRFKFPKLYLWLKKI